jgi:hypothetical protein
VRPEHSSINFPEKKREAASARRSSPIKLLIQIARMILANEVPIEGNALAAVYNEDKGRKK